MFDIDTTASLRSPLRDGQSWLSFCTTIILLLFSKIGYGEPPEFTTLLQQFRKMSIKDEDSKAAVTARSQQLRDEFSNENCQADILYTTALIHARNGHMFPENSHLVISEALRYPQVPARKLLLTMYLGDSATLLPLEIAERRRLAATAYLAGLDLCSQLDPTELMSSPGQPELTVAQYREKFERQLAWIYHDRAADLNELRTSLDSAGQSPTVADRVLTHAASLKPPGPRPESNRNYMFRAAPILIANVMILVVFWLVFRKARSDSGSVGK